LQGVGGTLELFTEQKMSGKFSSKDNQIIRRRKILMKASIVMFGLLLIGISTIATDYSVEPQPTSTRSSPTIEILATEKPTSTIPAQEEGSANRKGNDKPPESLAESVGKWKRFEVVMSNLTWSGNPFDLELIGVFKHIPSGRVINQLGFYAGDNTWKIYFMPDVLGEWTYQTQSPDVDLNGITGSFNCISSGLPGRLIGDGNRWLLEDSGEYVAPIMVPTREWFKRSNTNEGIDDFIQWADDTVGAIIIGITLVYFDGAQDEIPYVKGQEGELFNIPMWDRMNSHYDMMRDRGMGLYIMFYSDDEESPNRHNIKQRSLEELRLFKYAIARFSAYPIVMWDTGIDIQETRDNEWIDEFTDWFNMNDPWRHPVSSRTGGGSGGKFPKNGTYYSDGASSLPSHQTVVSDWMRREVPTTYTDRWRENYHRGGFDRDEIRRAVWEVGLVGGSAIYVGGNENAGHLTETYAKDFEAAPDIGLRTRFFQEQILDFRLLNPSDELVLSGRGVVLSANRGREYVAYDHDGGSFSLDLNNVTGSLTAEWFNPRTGGRIDGGTVQGGGARTFTTPTQQDWVLHLLGEGAGRCSLNISPELKVLVPPILSKESDNLLVFRLFQPLVYNCRLKFTN
jgi:hypothetical protein